MCSSGIAHPPLYGGMGGLDKPSTIKMEAEQIVGKLIAEIKSPSAIGSLLILPVWGAKIKCVSWPKPTLHLMSLPSCIEEPRS